MIPKVFESEFRFCLILWEHEPIQISELIKICSEDLGWNRSTTYTVIRRLKERGVLKSENSIISSLISREQIQEAQMNEMIDKTFEGSIPAFIAAFSKAQNLTETDLEEITRLINSRRT